MLTCYTVLWALRGRITCRGLLQAGCLLSSLCRLRFTPECLPLLEHCKQSMGTQRAHRQGRGAHSSAQGRGGGVCGWGRGHLHAAKALKVLPEQLLGHGRRDARNKDSRRALRGASARQRQPRLCARHANIIMQSTLANNRTSCRPHLSYAGACHLTCKPLAKCLAARLHHPSPPAKRQVRHKS